MQIHYSTLATPSYFWLTAMADADGKNVLPSAVLSGVNWRMHNHLAKPDGTDGTEFLPRTPPERDALTRESVSQSVRG